jgi:Na+-driven multidrug efflux pump
VLPLGAPVAAGQIFVGIIFALVQYFAKRFGSTDAVAAAGIVLRIYAAALFLILGFTRGVQPLAGMIWGRGDLSQLRELLVRSAVMLFLFTGLLTAGMLLFPEEIITAFSGKVAIVETGALFLRYVFAGILPFAFQLFGAGVFQALGDIRKTYFLLFVRNVACLLPGLVLLPLLTGLPGVFLSFAAADGLSTLLVFAYIRRSRIQ